MLVFHSNLVKGIHGHLVKGNMQKRKEKYEFSFHFLFYHYVKSGPCSYFVQCFVGFVY